MIKIIHVEDSPMKTNSKVILAVGGLALLPKINPKYLPLDSNEFLSKSRQARYDITLKIRFLGIKE
jgi:hypothetical protein